MANSRFGPHTASFGPRSRSSAPPRCARRSERAAEDLVIVLADARGAPPDRRPRIVELDRQPDEWLGELGGLLQDFNGVGLRFLGEFGERIDRRTGNAGSLQA